jgi:hypothetical protein
MDDTYVSGGTSKSIPYRKETLCKVLRNSAKYCDIEHSDLLQEWGTVEIADTGEEPPNSSTHHYIGALPHNLLHVTVTNPDTQQRTGLTFYVHDFTASRYTEYGDTHMYQYEVKTLPNKWKTSIEYELMRVGTPVSLFDTVDRYPTYHISLEEPLVKELLVLSFIFVNGDVFRYNYDETNGIHFLSRQGTRFTYQPRGWLYYAKYGEAVLKDTTYKFETAQAVADFVKILTAIKPPTPAQPHSRKLATAERLTDIIHSHY